MKVLITGGGGNLGRVLAPALAEKGHEPVLMDNRPLEGPYRSVIGDVREKTDVREAVRGTDVVVHAAALHGIHLDKYPSDDFWDLNVTGTHHVYEAVREHGAKVLLCSSMAAYGESVKELEDGFAIVTEDLPLVPTDVYGLTKTLCEEMAGFYYRRHGIRTVAFRFGMFVPETFVGYGFRLLKGGVDDRDVAQALLLGLEDESITFDAFNVMAAVPFSEGDFARWRRDPKGLLEERFPGVLELAGERGADAGELLRTWGHTYWSIEKANRVLGYEPRHNFPEFYAALKRGDESYYPYANLAWWGV